MICKRCGQNLSNGTTQCSYCGQILSDDGQLKKAENQPTNAVKINTHLTEAILVTVLCCMPFGIAAIVNAAQVSTLVSVGKYAEAQEASKKAAIWATISLVIGIVIYILGIIGTLASPAE